MIGVDLVVVSRIENALEKHGAVFLAKFLSESEIALVRRKDGFNAKRAAGFFAAKEALSKALGCGISENLAFHDIIISKDSLNAPKIRVKKPVKKHFKIRKIALSITHDGDYAIAVVLVKCGKA